MRACDRILDAAAVPHHDAHTGRRILHPQHADAATEVQALARQRLEQNGGAFRILSGQWLLGFQDRDPRAQAAKCLRKFEADRPPTDDDQMLGAYREVETDSLVR